MESGSAGGGYGDRVADELARLRDALDDLRRRPIPPDADTLRHVVTASLTEATAPPPNLLVTAIRRLDRLDARLESIEAALGAPAALPRGADVGRGRASMPAASVSLPPPSPIADPEAIADALARRLAGMVPSRSAGPPPSATPGATVHDLVSVVRPLVPDAARSVLRRAGREPSPQAVEVLQQTALGAIEEAARAAGLHSGSGADPWAPDPRPLAAPPQPQALTPAPPPPPAIDVGELAATIAAQVAAAVTAQLPPPVEQPAARAPAPAPPAPPPPLDPKIVADAVVSRLAEQPPPQAVVSPMAMAPLLSAVGNVEAAVARIAEPEPQVVKAVDRLEAGVEALARALEDDRSLQADEVRRGFAQLHDLLQYAPLKPVSDQLDEKATDAGPVAAEEAVEVVDVIDVTDAGGGELDRLVAAIAGVQRRLDRLGNQLEPLGASDLAASVPELARQGQRLERSLNHILTALAALAEHLSEQSSRWRERFDELCELVTAAARTEAPTGREVLPDDLVDLRSRIDELVSGLAADRQRFQRLGGTIDGLAELLGLVSSRLDRLPRSIGAKPSPADEDAAVPAPTADPSPAPAEVPPPATSIDEEPPEPEAEAEAVVGSPWGAPDDEPWMRDDPWSHPDDQDDQVPASPEPDGTAADAATDPPTAAIGPDEPAGAPSPVVDDGFGDPTGDHAELVTGSDESGSTLGAEAEEDQLAPPSDGRALAEPRRRRRRSRRRNGRG